MPYPDLGNYILDSPAGRPVEGRDDENSVHKHLRAILLGRAGDAFNCSLIAMLCTGYMDESGCETDRIFLTAGFVGSNNMWDAFSKDWEKARKGPPELPPLHMTDFMSPNPKDGFEVLDKTTREFRLLQFIDVIEKHNPQPLIIKLNIREYKDSYKQFIPKLPKRLAPMRSPYFPTAVKAVEILTGYGLWKKIDPGTVEILFEDIGKCGRAVRDFVDDSLMPNLQKIRPELAQYFGDARWIKKHQQIQYPGLQAADMFAWHYRRAAEEDFGDELKSFRELRRVITKADCLFVSMHPDELWANSLMAKGIIPPGQYYPIRPSMISAQELIRLQGKIGY